jgi:O-acetyl-ADP-ribose deacetylase
MAAPIEIDVWQGDLAELEVDALVVGASESLFMTAGAAASVKRLGGEEVEREAVDQGPIRPGEAVATTGGQLATPYVIHAVGVGHDRVADPAQLDRAVRAALAFGSTLRLRRIAMALIGVEHGAFAPDDAAAIQVRAILDAAARTPIEAVVLASVHPVETRALSDAVRSIAAEAQAS